MKAGWKNVEHQQKVAKKNSKQGNIYEELSLPVLASSEEYTLQVSTLLHSYRFYPAPAPVHFSLLCCVSFPLHHSPSIGWCLPLLDKTSKINNLCVSCTVMLKSIGLESDHYEALLHIRELEKPRLVKTPYLACLT